MISSDHRIRLEGNRTAADGVQLDMLDRMLAAHDGVITRAQARTCGLSDDAIDRLLRSGAWCARSRGVYFVANRPFTADARIRTVVWGGWVESRGQWVVRCLLAPNDHCRAEHYRRHRSSIRPKSRRGMSASPPRSETRGHRRAPRSAAPDFERRS